jgi:hypothetical protein
MLEELHISLAQHGIAEGPGDGIKSALGAAAVA